LALVRRIAAGRLGLCRRCAKKGDHENRGQSRCN
jgi:hypothetical protein